MRLVTGDDTGLVKVIDVERKKIPVKFGNQTKGNDVVGMCWSGAEDLESRLTVARKSGAVELWDTAGNIQKSVTLPTPAKRIWYHNNTIGAISKEGAISVVQRWHDEPEVQEVMSIPGPINDAKCDVTTGRLLAGGLENDLKIYDLARGDTPVWKAKNVQLSTLELRVPVRINTVEWYGPGSHIAVVGTLDGKVRVYDTRAKRRPVIDLPLVESVNVGCAWTGTGQKEDLPLYASCVIPQKHHIVFGNNVGGIYSFDMRNLPTVRASLGSQVHGRKAHKEWAKKQLPFKGMYKGPSGSIRSLAAHPSGDYIAAVGLDRHVTVFDTNKRRMAKTICKVYLKQKLNCVLMSSEAYAPKQEEPQEESTSAGVDDDLPSDRDLSDGGNDAPSGEEGEISDEEQDDAQLELSDESGEDEAHLEVSDESENEEDDSHLVLEDESEEENSEDDENADDRQIPQPKRRKR